MLLAVLVAVGIVFQQFSVHAADSTISYKAGANIPLQQLFYLPHEL